MVGSRRLFYLKGRKLSRAKMFTTVSLLNIEGKILFISVLEKSWLNIERKILFISVLEKSWQSICYKTTTWMYLCKKRQPTCVGMLRTYQSAHQIIWEARENKEDLAVIWLDLTDDYGTEPQQLVDTTYHVQEELQFKVARGIHHLFSATRTVYHYWNYWMQYLCDLVHSSKVWS